MSEREQNIETEDDSSDTTAGTVSNPIIDGVIWRQLLLFFIPTLTGSFFQQFYSVADAVIVGRFAGKHAFAAIDLTAILFRLPVDFFIGTSMGATILISQAYGAADRERVSKLVHTSVGAAALFGVMLSAAGFLFARDILGMMNAPADIMEDSLLYARILFAGLFLPLIFNMLCGVLRAAGDSRRPFLCLCFCSAANIIADIVFIAVFKWGVAGAAYATVLAQAMSVALAAFCLLRTDDAYRLVPSKIGISVKHLMNILRTGVPVGLQSSAYFASNILIHARLNTHGTDIIAAYASASKADFIIWLILEAFSISVATFAAQNYGARRLDRVQRSVAVTLRAGFASVGVLVLLWYTFSAEIVGIFMPDAHVVRMSSDVMRFMAPWYLAAVFSEILPGALRAVGSTFIPMLLTMISPFALRIAWILIVPQHFESLYALIAVYPVSWVVTALLFIVYYPFHSRRLRDRLRGFPVEALQS